MLNSKQQRVMWLGIIMLVAISIYPPWQYSKVNLYSPQVTETTPVGHYLIFEVPEFSPGRSSVITDTGIDIQRYLIYLIIIIVITAGLLLVFKGREVETRRDIKWQRNVSLILVSLGVCGLIYLTNVYLNLDFDGGVMFAIGFFSIPVGLIVIGLLMFRVEIKKDLLKA